MKLATRNENMSDDFMRLKGVLPNLNYKGELSNTIIQQCPFLIVMSTTFTQ